jgi:hypothetical protein
VVVAVDVGGGRFVVGRLWLWLIETWERFGFICGLGLFWVTRPLPSRVGTYLTFLRTTPAPMAQQLSACFTATAKGRVFESAKKQMFFCTKLN